MEACLLCLDVKSEVDDIIIVDSIQWQEEDMKHLIEKYLWPMDITHTSYMCNRCWQELYCFHKFYVRIEKAHAMLDNINEMQHVKEELIEETEILMEEHLITQEEIKDENSLLKVEDKDETPTENTPYKKKRKRGRPSKNVAISNEDPLKKTKINSSMKTKVKSNNTCGKLNVQLESSLVVDDNKNSNIKEETIAIEISRDLSISDANENYDSDSKYEDNDDKKSFEALKKKRKNPDENTRKEHDKIIAEYFKIYCSLCQIPLENFIALRKHFRDEHSKRGFVICCKKKIFTRPLLVDHIHFHLNPNYFKCKQCEKVYSERCTLESHLKSHEGQNDRNHTCDICGKTFVGTSQLENHKLTHEPDYEKQFSCSECGKFFTSLSSLSYHIRAIHLNRYVKICDICGKTMRCRFSFKLHMEKHDNKLAAPINCDICGLRLIDRRGLRRHKNSQHPVGGKKEYSCHICSKISPNLRAHRRHVRFTHEIGYIHKCTMCEKAFKKRENLKEHLATHTGKPLYTCPWCPKTFISNGNMHSHRKKSHPKEWEEAKRQRYGEITVTNNT